MKHLGASEYYAELMREIYGETPPGSFGTTLKTPSLTAKAADPSAVDRSHYQVGRKLQPWDVIDDWRLDYYLGTAVEYIGRIGRKAPDAGQTRAEKDIQDIDKAIDYLNQKRRILAGGKP